MENAIDIIDQELSKNDLTHSFTSDFPDNFLQSQSVLNNEEFLKKEEEKPTLKHKDLQNICCLEPKLSNLQHESLSFEQTCDENLEDNVKQHAERPRPKRKQYSSNASTLFSSPNKTKQTPDFLQQNVNKKQISNKIETSSSSKHLRPTIYNLHKQAKGTSMTRPKSSDCRLAREPFFNCSDNKSENSSPILDYTCAKHTITLHEDYSPNIDDEQLLSPSDITERRNVWSRLSGSLDRQAKKEEDNELKDLITDVSASMKNSSCVVPTLLWKHALTERSAFPSVASSRSPSSKSSSSPFFSDRQRKGSLTDRDRYSKGKMRTRFTASSASSSFAPHRDRYKYPLPMIPSFRSSSSSSFGHSPSPLSPRDANYSERGNSPSAALRARSTFDVLTSPTPFKHVFPTTAPPPLGQQMRIPQHPQLIQTDLKESRIIQEQKHEPNFHSQTSPNSRMSYSSDNASYSERVEDDDNLTNVSEADEQFAEKENEKMVTREKDKKKVRFDFPFSPPQPPPCTPSSPCSGYLSSLFSSSPDSLLSPTPSPLSPLASGSSACGVEPASSFRCSSASQTVPEPFFAPPPPSYYPPHFYSELTQTDITSMRSIELPKSIETQTEECDFAVVQTRSVCLSTEQKDEEEVFEEPKQQPVESEQDNTEELNEQRKKVWELKMQLEKALNWIETLEKEKRALEEENAKEKENWRREKDEKEKMKEEKRLLEQRIQELKEEKLELLRANEKTKKMMAEMKDEVERRKEELQQEKERVKKLISEKNDLSAEIKKVNEKLDDVNNLLGQKNEEIARLEKELQKSQEALRKWRSLQRTRETQTIWTIEEESKRLMESSYNELMADVNVLEKQLAKESERSCKTNGYADGVNSMQNDFFKEQTENRSGLEKVEDKETESMREDKLRSAQITPTLSKIRTKINSILALKQSSKGKNSNTTTMSDGRFSQRSSPFSFRPEFHIPSTPLSSHSSFTTKSASASPSSLSIYPTSPLSLSRSSFCVSPMPLSSTSSIHSESSQLNSSIISQQKQPATTFASQQTSTASTASELLSESARSFSSFQESNELPSSVLSAIRQREGADPSANEQSLRESSLQLQMVAECIGFPQYSPRILNSSEKEKWKRENKQREMIEQQNEEKATKEKEDIENSERKEKEEEYKEEIYKRIDSIIEKEREREERERSKTKFIDIHNKEQRKQRNKLKKAGIMFEDEANRDDITLLKSDKRKKDTEKSKKKRQKTPTRLERTKEFELTQRHHSPSSPRSPRIASSPRGSRSSSPFQTVERSASALSSSLANTFDSQITTSNYIGTPDKGTFMSKIGLDNKNCEMNEVFVKEIKNEISEEIEKRKKESERVNALSTILLRHLDREKDREWSKAEKHQLLNDGNCMGVADWTWMDEQQMKGIFEDDRFNWNQTSLVIINVGNLGKIALKDAATIHELQKNLANIKALFSGICEALHDSAITFSQQLELLHDTLRSIKVINESMTVDLSCRSCLKLMTEPITFIPCGHTICKTCAYSLGNDGKTRCFECSNDLPRGYVRNFIVENLVAREEVKLQKINELEAAAAVLDDVKAKLLAQITYLPHQQKDTG
ncbi:uncharacterized protein MONOS_1118 [Monocercomonoides exilis]|uniref:uncharacterized protein n=1 Tax=Monocercomonoides exilis TaxID=2049356 RepID=UPI00355A6B45|nr:hypothetical protein MONOS_1118 [Monocercomonoides exilis]|eukprot:MONOS_1118.1-p1 / transcript=MONOS_1118.1 / gene=MONOS_1118 / organism=Monocercomonoides_exilis_PA203 / gene_product=unspecified product / transcript_product=unspecified product / location=Mono_scaffold00019:19422-24988(+) / protein_length=1587 / sequence_SO=supercontig / SO=protein_coding / is_pseudo=false